MENKTQALTVAEPSAPPMIQILNKALESGVTPEVMEKLLAVQQRWEAGEAKKAFDKAMAKAKAEIPVLHKGNAVNFGNTHYQYEDLASIARTIDPILSKHGLGYRWRTDSDAKTTSVTCIVSHELGHSEETKLAAPNDQSGNKNAIQAIGSAVTYLQRYSLKAALGLSASADDDARSVSVERPNKPAVPSSREAAPTPMAAKKRALEPKPDATKAERDYFVKVCQPIKAQMHAYMVEKNIILETEGIEDCPLDKVPRGPAVRTVIERCCEWSGADVPEIPEPVTEDDHPDLVPAETTIPEGANLFTGFLKMVKENPTSKGGTNYSLLLVEDMEDKEGGIWVSTFSDTDGNAAKTLEGEEVNAYWVPDKTGKYKNLCENGISPTA